MPANGADDSAEYDGFVPLYDAEMSVRVPLPRHVIVSKWKQAAKKVTNFCFEQIYVLKG